MITELISTFTAASVFILFSLISSTAASYAWFTNSITSVSEIVYIMSECPVTIFLGKGAQAVPHAVFFYHIAR